MLNKTTNRGTSLPLPYADSYFGTYYFLTTENTYYYSDGQKWIKKPLDTSDASPETEAKIICGISPENAIVPIKADSEGNLMVSGSPKAATFVTRSGTTTAPTPASKMVVDYNPDRQYFFFSNPSDTDMYISVGTAATTSSILVGKGGGGIAWENFVPTNAIYVYCGAITAKAYVAYEA